MTQAAIAFAVLICLAIPVLGQISNDNVSNGESKVGTIAEAEKGPDEPLFEAVVDNTWLTHEETPAYYALLEKARQTPVSEIRQQGRELVSKRKEQTRLPTFVDIWKNPKEWRGKPVFLKGHVLQTVEYDPAPNDYGIDTLYESSLFIDDSQGHPITVVFTEKPDNLPLGGELVDGVEVAGYFFKVFWYPSSDKQTREAPLILAKTVSVRSPKSFGPVIPPGVSWTAIGLLAVAIVFGLWRMKSLDQERRRKQRERVAKESPPEFVEP
ncbi:MAG: hypothetical protein KDA80_08020 [Planctomycetaceae bacterium]|nr:hypothetical protein [Planctomycetaceae bacterium]